MIYTNDLYIVIGKSLIVQGYSNMIDIPFEIIKKEIKKYLMVKLYEDNDSKNIDELFTKLESYINERDKIRVMGNIIHYLLWYMSLIQNYEIIWYIEDNKAKPIVRESESAPGKIDGLIRVMI